MLFKDLSAEAQDAIAQAAMGVEQTLSPELKAQVTAWAEDPRNFTSDEEPPETTSLAHGN